MTGLSQRLSRTFGLRCEICGSRCGARMYYDHETGWLLIAHIECMRTPDGNHSWVEGIYSDPYYAEVQG